jgi:acyl carrier protein
MNDTVKTRLKEVLADSFNLSPEAIPDDAKIGDLEQWTSLGHLELMMSVEMKFGVQIPMEGMLELVSLQALEEFLIRQGVAG